MSFNNRSGGRRRGGPDLSKLPIEQGIICSLKESFGFIHCAERPEEIFFHYSEVTGCHPDDLQIDTEVEFRVGSSEKDSNKTSAYSVRPLEPGSVVWEIEDEPDKLYQGMVERSIRNDTTGPNNRGNTEGSIQILLEEPGSESSNEKKGPQVRFRPEDIVPDPKSRNSKLVCGDLVQFRIFLDRRTKQKYARHIVVLQKERERARDERESKLLQSATEEEGMVISLHKGFGFLKSNKRTEHVYFHYSNLMVPEDQDDFELKKGQEMKFLVVTEIVDGQAKCAARKLECLPKGTVQFHTVVAKGLKGTVMVCPLPPSAGNDRGFADDKNGTIRLLEPLVDKDFEGNETTVTDISFEFSDAPGGVYTFQQRGAPTNGLWILEGDILLFDVVKEIADGSYQAAPTSYTLSVGGAIEDPKDPENVSSMIRLVACSLVSRAEGTMHTLKVQQGGYGFIHFAERPVDVHFQTYNLMPEEVASDLRKQLGYSGDEVKLEVGVGAQFDICAHGTVHSIGGRGGGANRRRVGNAAERENMKAHRILLLPKDAVSMNKVLGKEMKGTIKAADTKQLYAGFVDLEEEIEPMSLNERHPLVAAMIDSFIEESSKPHGRKQLVYRDVLSIKDDEVVVEMVKSKAGGILTYDHIPVPGIDSTIGRLVIRRVEEACATIEVDEKGVSKKKKKQSKTPPKMNVRFDKASLIDDLKEDLPPNAGDSVICDVTQDRRTGKISIENLRIVERNHNPPAIFEDASEPGVLSGRGVVQNVVPKSNFGFISVLDEKASRQELLLFSLSKEKNPNKTQFKKGDEVKFDIGVDPQTGKRVAQNIEVLSPGTIPSKASKNACRGIVLIEPTHTSLSDTPLRKKASGDASNGKWASTKGDPHKIIAEMHEKGVILLLEDKGGLFSKRSTQGDRKRSGSIDSVDGAGEKIGSDVGTDCDSTDDDRSVESGISSDGDQTGAILSHLPYRNGELAILGAGSAGGMGSSGNPKRGDLVTFTKARKGFKVRDIRVEKRNAAKFVRGRLEQIRVQESERPKKNAGTAKFIAATEKEEVYDIDLREVVSCDVHLLKNKQQVEGILHQGDIFGICRTSDLYLESKLGRGNTERPKLNLSVKKDRGGKIIAQSHMAKGPDGSTGFAAGWTARTSQYASNES